MRKIIKFEDSDPGSVSCDLLYMFGVGETREEQEIDCCKGLLRLWEHFNTGDRSEVAKEVGRVLNALISKAML